ncbi:YisL family protein [Bombilactobacillus folatiphilus]|uniref:YisL family protein n=1 Tax=Bombilactobacillus folatiphilus TaxID=2923362 RepID=A0ABY4P7V1_9LACO|nr:DUF1516 family protein [Bombilactobacillus folatiphilus]UQS81671.1 YisL family protein [Bombilactobacillus folatiphilus]
MFWLWLHLICGVILVVAALLGLWSRNLQLWSMLARMDYLFLLLSGVMLIVHAWQAHPVLLIVKLVFVIIAIGILEMAFAKRRRNELSNSTRWLAVLLIVIVLGLGLWLTQGFPLF